MKTYLLIAMTALHLSTVQAADVELRSHQATSLPNGGRFEILQSTLAARWTFRLDKYSGRVWQLVRTKDDDNTWEETRVIDRPAVTTPLRAHYQIFTSGLAARHTFLIETDTGKTWLLVAGKRKDAEGIEVEYSIWQPFAD